MIALPFEIIGIACFAAIVAELSGIMDRVKYYFFKDEMGARLRNGEVYAYNWNAAKRLKPFDCPLCLAFWTGAVYFAATATDWRVIVLAPFVCAVLATGIVKAIKGRGI